MRTLRLVRETPGPDAVTAPTGVVADAAIFPDGRAVLHWRSGGTTELYDSEAEMIRIRERTGRSVFVDGVPCGSDHCEQCKDGD